MQRILTALIPAAVVLGAVAMGGCGGDDPFDPDRPRRGPAMQVGGQLAPVDEQGEPLGGRPAPPPPPQAKPSPDGGVPVPPPPPPPPGVVREAVKPGISGKGEGYGSGPVVTPLSLYFRIPERLVFNVQIPQAMNMYKGEHGYFPKTQEEFMQKIIAANAIALPELRTPKDRYVYDPQKAAKMSTYDTEDPPLMVEHPR